MSNKRNWRLYADDALECIQKIFSYTEGLDQQSFENSSLTYDATLRNLEILGESIGNLPADITETQAHIPWHFISGFRNRLAHGYFGIDNDIIWDIIENHLIPLEKALQALKEE